MQLAILVVLIIIAVVLAPWLLGLAAVLLAAYGVWVLVAALAVLVLLAVAVVVLFGWWSISSVFARKPSDSFMSKTIADVNRRYLAEEKERRLLVEDQLMSKAKADAEYKASSAKSCPHCAGSVPRYSLYCPKCGKDPKLN